MKKILVRLGAFLVPFMIVVTFVATFASAATVSPVQITSMSVAYFILFTCFHYSDNL